MKKFIIELKFKRIINNHFEASFVDKFNQNAIAVTPNNIFCRPGIRYNTVLNAMPFRMNNIYYYSVMALFPIVDKIEIIRKSLTICQVKSNNKTIPELEFGPGKCLDIQLATSKLKHKFFNKEFQYYSLMDMKDIINDYEANCVDICHNINLKTYKHSQKFSKTIKIT